MEKRLTDNEIVKALECCVTKGAKCTDCPAFVKVDRSNCKKYFRGAIDIINRLQAENERLKNAYKQCAWERDTFTEIKKEYIAKLIAKTKAEAYKEFADKLKLHAYHECDITGYRYLVVQIEEIDNLLKELVGENKCE